jgi:hypothetical protein
VDIVKNIPAPAVPAGGGESKAYGLLRMDEADFAKEFGLDTLIPENAAPAEQPRDTNGKFVAQETVLADTTLAKPAEPVVPAEAATPAEPEAVAEGETPVEQPKPKAPLTKFDVLDDAGQAVELPSVKIQFKDNGKMVAHDLAKVVSLAQMNSHNARQASALAETTAQQGQRLAELEQAIHNYEYHTSRMFTDPEVYDAARTTWLAANSPEQRAARLEQQVTSLQSQQSAVVEAGQVAQFLTGTIMPAVQQLVEQYDAVTEEDILGRFALALPAYQVNGRVPLANLPKVQQFVETELAAYAESVQGRRTKVVAAAKADADKSLQKEQAQSQALKRQVGKVLAPVSSQAQAPQAKPSSTVKRASDVMNDPLFGGGNS